MGNNIRKNAKQIFLEYKFDTGGTVYRQVVDLLQIGQYTFKFHKRRQIFLQPEQLPESLCSRKYQSYVRKGKVHHRTGHEFSTLSLTSALDGGG